MFSLLWLLKLLNEYVSEGEGMKMIMINDDSIFQLG